MFVRFNNFIIVFFFVALFLSSQCDAAASSCDPKLVQMNKTRKKHRVWKQNGFRLIKKLFNNFPRFIFRIFLVPINYIRFFSNDLICGEHRIRPLQQTMSSNIIPIEFGCFLLLFLLKKLKNTWLRFSVSLRNQVWNSKNTNFMTQWHDDNSLNLSMSQFLINVIQLLHFRLNDKRPKFKSNEDEGKNAVTSFQLAHKVYKRRDREKRSSKRRVDKKITISGPLFLSQ